MIQSPRKTLPAIRLSEEILRLSFDIQDDQIREALDKLSLADSTYGILWGLDNIRLRKTDADLYELKKKVLLFIQELREDPNFHLAITIKVALERDLTEKTEETSLL